MKNLILATSVLLVTLVIVDAGKKLIGECKYISPRQKALCVNGTRTMTWTLKKKLKPDAVCNDTTVITKPCRVKKKCKYDFSVKVECVKMVEVKLLKGDDGCSPTMQVPCKRIKRKQSKWQMKNERRQNKKDTKNRKKEFRKKAKKDKKMKKKLEKLKRKQNRRNNKKKGINKPHILEDDD